MMTDRELLEKAAEAAGYRIFGWIGETFYVIHGYSAADNYDPFTWNPLKDDGDAFRLMVDLQIDVEMNCNIIVATSPEHHEVDEETGEWGPIVDQSAMRAATRRAIVRAAASLAG